MIPKIDTPLQFPCGASMKNRFMLAPLTNKQSHEDGTLSDVEFNWLSMRAKGGFGLVMTCASHVQFIGKGFPGQLGIYDDNQIPGHQRLTKEIQSQGALAVIQLHHAGMRTPAEIIGEAPVCPSPESKSGARGLTLEEIHLLRDDFIQAALRAKKAGYDGVEVHGAHGYILTQFLSTELNHRSDEYGGSLENRARIILEIVEGIRKVCGPDFLLGIRLSPERFGMQLDEIKTLFSWLVEGGQVDFIDMSLWDCFKLPEEENHRDRTLIQHFADLDRKDVKLTVAGKIRSGQDVRQVMAAGVDFVTIGRSAILHHDFPKLVMADPDFIPVENPVSRDHLQSEGLSDIFIDYMGNWPGFVAGD